MYRSLFPRGLFAEMDRLPRGMQRAFDLDLSPIIRGLPCNGFPVLNVGSTPETLEIYAFAPGVDPSSLQVLASAGRN